MTKNRFDWIIARIRQIFYFWDKGLNRCDKAYCLRRIRDKEPELFFEIANER